METPPVERRHEDVAGVGAAKLYLFSALGLIVLMVLTFLVLVVVKPEMLEQRAARNLGYFLALCITGLFAAAGINVANVLNGQSAVMTRLVGEKEHAKGKLEGLQEHSKTNR